MKVSPVSQWFKTNGWRGLLINVIVPVVVYTLVALFITWPLVTQLSTHVAGPEYGDSFEYTRLGWWARYAVQHGLNPFYQSLLGYPEGFFSATQWAQPLTYWPIALLGYVFNPVASFNLWLLSEVILNGLAAYVLCRDLLRDSPRGWIASLFGGLVFMASPVMQGHMIAGHINPLANYAFPILILCTLRIIEDRGGLRTALVGAVSILILALGNFTFPAFLLLPLVLFGGGYLLLFQRDRLLRRKTLRNLAVLFGGGVLLMVPFYIPLLSDIAATNRPSYLLEGGWTTYSTDALGFVALSPFTSWFGPIAPVYSRMVLGTNAFEGPAYLGIIAVVLAIIALWRRRKWAGFWLAIALGCMLFALGPALKVNNELVTYTLGNNLTDGSVRSNIVLPWALFQNLPLISATRTPGRFNFTTMLAFGVLAALGLDVLLQRIGRRELRSLLVGALTIGMLAEYQLFFPFLTTSAALPDYFKQLASRDDVHVVFNVPWDLGQREALNEQMVHQKPVIAGYVSRRTPVDPAKLTLLSNLAIGQAYIDDKIQPDRDTLRSILRENGIDVLIYHWLRLNKDILLPWAIQNFHQPVYQDANMAIFEIPAPETPVNNIAFTFSNAGWWRRTPAETIWLTGDSSIYLYTPDERDTHWTLALAPLLHTRSLQLTVDGVLARAWQVDSPTKQIDFWLKLSPGFHRLRFTLPEGCTPVPVMPTCLLYDGSAHNEQSCTLRPDEQDLCVGMALNTLQVQPSAAMALQPHSVRLFGSGTEIFLQAFRMPTEAKSGVPLPVETDWQAAQPPAGDYHLFIQMLDQNGKLAAQYDNVPGGGTFSTTRWTASQTWIEAASLALPADLTPGTYSVFVGWYRYPEVARLTVDAQTPHAQDGLVYLSDIIVK
ncbi:MAG: hypothetical protein ABI947_10840 [Chloroflexota bacterium]